MICLSVELINQQSPYEVHSLGGGLVFSTESGVEYSVHFTEEFAIGECDTYQFMFSKLTKDHVPFDLKISQTLIVIIEEFFRANHNVLLYICDTSDNREASRNRFFANWFRRFAERGAYEFRSANSSIEGEGFYAAIIVERSNPKLQAVLEDFDKSAKELTK